MDPAPTRRVLIVDDDPSIRRLLVAFMRCKGFQLLEARNGRDALAVMRAGEADLVVMDLMMPEVSGWDVLRQREKEPALRRIPLVVITASDIRQIAADVAGKHVAAVIGKPFDLDSFLSTVMTCLGGNMTAPVAA